MIGITWQLSFTTWVAFITCWQLGHRIVNCSRSEILEVGIPVFIRHGCLTFHGDRGTRHNFLRLV